MTTPQIALIVHEIIDNPTAWTDKGKFITNGYYDVWLDGSRYGMGAASYNADGSERITLNRALNIWKEETGWSPEPEPSHDQSTPPARTIVQPDVFIRQAHEEFHRAVRNTHRSFTVHGDPNIFGGGILNALSKLDSVLRPMEKIEGKKNAESGGVSGA